MINVGVRERVVVGPSCTLIESRRRGRPLSNLLYLLLLLITCLSCGIEKLYVSWYDIELRNVNLQKEADSVTFKLRQKKKKKPKKKNPKKQNKQKKTHHILLSSTCCLIILCHCFSLLMWMV